MKRRVLRSRLGGLLLAGLLAALMVPLLVGGCGEKIVIPEPTGLWTNLAYALDDTFELAGIRQLTVSWSNLFVLSSNSLSKRNLVFEPDTTITLTGDPTAMCVEETGALVFVWEQSTSLLSIYDSTKLEYRGSAFLPEVSSVTSMVTNSAGMDTLIVGGRTFLYLSDPVASRIHRYVVMGAGDEAFTCTDCLEPVGDLAWPTGSGARSVHQPGGLANDSEGRLLACEMDPERNWVIRFDSKPDSTDTTPTTPDDQPTWAGRAVVFGEPTCEPDPAAADYVLGNAAVCGQSDWVGGASDVEGSFDQPVSLAVDGSGQIFVADRDNDRVQIFGAQGEYQGSFRIRGDNGKPISIGLVDDRQDASTVHYSAFVFVLVEGSDQVYKFISEESYLERYGELPPYEE